MTRGLVIIKDGWQQEVLYLPSDAHVGGSMNLALEYCEANYGKKTSVQELALGLMKAIPGLRVYSETSNPGLDNVYTIELNAGICPDNFVYQKTMAECDYDDPMPTSLSEKRNYRVDCREKERAANEYWQHQQELKESILPCPHCGMKGWHNIAPKGEIVRCFVDTCPGSKAGKWCETFDEAIDEWNRYVLSVKKQ